eukprot:5539813-Prymnesium_polylepis.1
MPRGPSLIWQVATLHPQSSTMVELYKAQSRKNTKANWNTGVLDTANDSVRRRDSRDASR